MPGRSPSERIRLGREVSDFTPYPKVADAIDDWGLDEAELRACDRIRWVATEKVHGAHVCLVVSEERIEVAKRRRVLDDEDEFFDARRVLGDSLGGARRLFAELRAARGAEAVLIYGELFGGRYPHPDVAAVEGVHPIQSGVSYSPDVAFMAFDLGIVRASDEPSDEPSDETVELLPFAACLEHLRRAELPVVPVVHVGTLREALALPTTFQTRVPAALGLPELPSNRAEGLVIRAYDEASPAIVRARLKRKHEAFAETAYHEAEPWPRSHARSHGSEALERAEGLVSAMLTDNRIDSAISKIGRPTTPRLEAEVAAEVERDVREELERGHGDVVLALGREDHALLWSVAADAIRDAVADHVRPAKYLDPARYRVELELAFIRGRLPEVDGGSAEALVTAAREAGLRLHKFKRKDGPPRVTSVLSILEGLAPRRVLDVGSGRGAFLWPLLDRFPALEVVAIDQLPHRVRDIEAVRRGGIDRVRGLLADVGALPFADDDFDVVTILEVLEHLEDPAPAAAEVVRAARSFVVASVPSKPDDNPEHLRLFTPSSLTALLMSAGARRVQIRHVRNHMLAIARCGS